jgi:hypothetical protein
MLEFVNKMYYEELGRNLVKSDLALLKSMKVFVGIVSSYTNEWKQVVDIEEVDAWLEDGGYVEVFRKYKLDHAAWLSEFQSFFMEAWEIYPDFVPTEVDWGFYHKVRDGGLPGCPNLGVTLERAIKVVMIDRETDEIYRRAAEVNFKAW